MPVSLIGVVSVFPRGSSVGYLFVFFTRSMDEVAHIVKKGKYIREYFWRSMDFLLKMRLVVLVVVRFDSGVYVKYLYFSFSMIY